MMAAVLFSVVCCSGSSVTNGNMITKITKYAHSITGVEPESLVCVRQKDTTQSKLGGSFLQCCLSLCYMNLYTNYLI